METNVDVLMTVTGSVDDIGKIVGEDLTHNYTFRIIFLSFLGLLILLYFINEIISTTYERKIKKDVIDYHTKIAEGHQNIISQQHGTIHDFINNLLKK